MTPGRAAAAHRSCHPQPLFPTVFTRITYNKLISEYAYSMKVTEKGDIYSFGVILLELVTGKQPIQPLDQGGDLVTYARRLFQTPAATSIIFDERMDISQKVLDEMELVLKIAFFCTSASPFERPTMREVVSMLIEARENSVNIVSSPTSETPLHMT